MGKLRPIIKSGTSKKATYSSLIGNRLIILSDCSIAYIDSDEAKFNHSLARKFVDEGCEVLFFTPTFSFFENSPNTNKITDFETTLNGVRYLIGITFSQGQAHENESALLCSSLYELIQVYRPAGMLCSANAKLTSLVMSVSTSVKIPFAFHCKDSETAGDADIIKHAASAFVYENKYRDQLINNGFNPKKILGVDTKQNTAGVPTNFTFDVTSLLAALNIKNVRAKQSNDNNTHNLTALSQKPFISEFEIKELLPHTIKGDLKFELDSDKKLEKALVARVQYFDKNNQLIAPPYIGLQTSHLIGQFNYLNLSSDNLTKLVPPRFAVKAQVGLQIWHAKKKVWLRNKVSCELDTEQKVIGAEVRSKKLRCEAVIRPLSNIKIASILDEFSFECFRMEVDLLSISPVTWEQQLIDFEPDFLFVESCWFGNENQWGSLFYRSNSNSPNHMDTLVQVLNFCKRRGIPTVFWSKEDPVHYKKFGPTAKLFDFVYSSDSNMIDCYKKDFGIDAESLSFFCQPKIHNPTDIIPRVQKAVFAGSYYADKKERCDDFHTVLGALEKANVPYDIYDRCLKREISNLQYPEYFRKRVVGYLEPDEMWKAYKGYRYTVNMNSVKHSPTMFARRVYESLASGTPVVSNYSEGVVQQFGGIVCASDNQSQIISFLEQLSDENEYQRIVDEGVRVTLGQHTIADRLEHVCARLGIAVIPHLPIVNAIVTARTVDEVEKARHLVEKQTYSRKRLVVNLENNHRLYAYLKNNSKYEIFRISKRFYKPLDGINVSLDISDDIKPTLLESVALKTQYTTGN